jgi:uncharacterized membrane protein YcaP (DUF421 family)
LLRIVVVGVLAYSGLLIVLRVTGKRTLSKMNAFDFVITVALGSTVATVLLSSDVVLIEGLTALTLLVLLQFVVTWLSVRVPWVRRVVTGEPSLVLYRGEFLDDVLVKTRVTRSEVVAAVRDAGLARVETAQAVVLETDGSFSVITGGNGGAADTALTTVKTHGALSRDA